MAPHADQHAFANDNPRGTTVAARYEKALGPAAFQRYQKARAAHANGYENFPLFAATVLAGLHAGLPERAMSWVALFVLLLRAVYNELYMRVETRRGSYLRTLSYFVQTGTCLTVLVVAAVQNGA